MTSNNYVELLNLEFNESKLITEFKSIKLGIYNPHNDYTAGVHTTTWFKEIPEISIRKISPFLSNDALDSLPETNRILSELRKLLNTDINVIFTLQRKNKYLPLHKDPPDILAAINIVIGNTNAGVYFLESNNTYHYKIALLNIQEFHSVAADEENERMIIKFCISKKTFSDCQTILFKNNSIAN